jgi:hypothetical protein
MSKNKKLKRNINSWIENWINEHKDEKKLIK